MSNRGVAQKIMTSLTFRCAMCVAVYACAMALIFVAARSTSQQIVSAAYVTVETIAEQEDALEHDRFDLLAATLPQSSKLIIYDDKGNCVYASSSDIASLIPFDELHIVASTADDDVYYEVLEYDDSRQMADGVAFEIVLCEYREEQGTTRVLGQCLCDEDLNVLSGDLFPHAKRLTSEEFALIRGDFDKNMRIGKYEYETSDGESRTLAIVYPKVSELTYRKLLRESDKVWPVAIAVALLVTVAAICVMFRIIRGSMRPLDEAIRIRHQGGGRAPQAKDLPVELRATYERFVELMDGLDAAREENQTLIADVSHDLKTPLAVIGGYARAFEDGCVSPEKQATYLHAIYEKSQTANQLLDSLFAVAQLNHPAFSPTLETCDLCEEVRISVIAASAEVEQAGDVLEVDIANHAIWVALDRRLFSRVMGNLLSNACKHNPLGTKIRVTCLQKNDHAMVLVADDGTGFPENLREEAFEPFVTQNVARESGKGTGLGLTIARKGVLAHGGRIYLSDCPPRPFATEVTIELPLSSPTT